MVRALLKLETWMAIVTAEWSKFKLNKNSLHYLANFKQYNN